LDLSAHRGRTITLADVREAAVILVMTQSQRDALIAEFPDSRSRIHLMSELVGQVYDIADPYGASRAEYEVCADELDRLIQRGWTKILEWAQDANPSRTNPNLMQTAERVSPYA
jgi:protein-tyrosine phosphatase